MIWPVGQGPSRDEDDQAFHRAIPSELPPSSCGGGNGERLSLTEGSESDRPVFPLQDLAALLGVEIGSLSRRLNISGSTWKQYRDHGVSLDVADRLANKVGFHPAEVWPEWTEHSTAKASKDCAECGESFVPFRSDHRFCCEGCGQRAYSRRWHRERYRTDPEFRKARIAQSAAYRRYVKARRKTEVECPECGERFERSKVGHVYCSRRCMTRVTSRRYRERKKGAA